jgi:hypothetical protein
MLHTGVACSGIDLQIGTLLKYGQGLANTTTVSNFRLQYDFYVGATNS